MNEYKLNQAQRYYDQGMHEAAIDLLKELLAENPEDAFCHGILGANLLAKGRIHAAEYELNIALSNDPEIGFLYVIMAQVCIMKNELQTALDFCDQALTLEVNSTDALLTKNEIYKKLGEYENALSCINAAAEITPDSVEVAVAYGELYLSKGKLEDALHYASVGLRAHAQDVDANILMGQIQLALNNIEETEYHAKLVMLQNPDNRAALQLFTSVKMRRSFIFGLWWRFNIKISNLSNIKSGLVLISAYLIFNLLSQIVEDLGYDVASSAISYMWLLLVVYTWVGIPYYRKMLNKELQKFSYNPDF